MSGKIILTSAGFTNGLVKDYLRDYFGNKEVVRIAMITTASREKENNRFVIKDKETLISMNFLVDCIDLENEPKRDLSSYDGFFVCGGNTFKLLKYAKKADFGESIKNLMKRGGVYFGISCGSLIVGPSVEIANEVHPDKNEVGLTDFTGLNIVPFVIYPHYSVEDEKEIVGFEAKHNIKVRRLTNNEALVLDFRARKGNDGGFDSYVTILS